MSLSVIVITKNESEDIGDCLASISWADEIIVLDSNSTDDTREIASSFGAKVESFPDWPGFGVQKQRALDLATSQWVLSLDADERVSPCLATEIQSLIRQSSELSPRGYEVIRHNYFLGKRLRFGGWGRDRILRLARRASCRFDLAPVHERLLVDGPVQRLKAPLIHLSYKNRQEILAKRLLYSSAGAEKLFSAGRVCIGNWEALFRGFWKFFYHAFFLLGFLDGRIGLYAAFCKASENYLKYRKLAELCQSKPRAPSR